MTEPNISWCNPAPFLVRECKVPFPWRRQEPISLLVACASLPTAPCTRLLSPNSCRLLMPPITNRFLFQPIYIAVPRSPQLVLCTSWMINRRSSTAVLRRSSPTPCPHLFTIKFKWRHRFGNESVFLQWNSHTVALLGWFSIPHLHLRNSEHIQVNMFIII